ncbi:MAG: PEGA domain-containing protein [Acidobacteriales bacterium]|nr:PEGA domain-containing protein [Terriglobales bacterium]
MPPGTGKVKIETRLKDAEVFVDGAFAGTVRETKDMYLKSGAHNLEIRAAGHPKYSERLYVLGGKTLKVSPGF